VFQDFLHVSRFEIPSTTKLNGSAKVIISMRDATMPVNWASIMQRWKEDIERVAGGVGGTRGQNMFNFGALIPAGFSKPLAATYAIRAGANNFILQQTDVEVLLKCEHRRRFKGSLPQVAAIVHIAHSLDPSLDNAVLWFIDYSQADNVQLEIIMRDFTGVFGAAASVADASLVDINQVSAIYVDVDLACVNQLNYASSQVGKPFAF